MELKTEVKNALLEKKEQDRKERIEYNSKLKEIIVYNQPGSCGVCDNVRKALEAEEIKYINKTISENEQEYNEITSLLNFSSRPIVVVNGYFLAYRRDFNSPEELVNIVRWVGNPTHVNSSHDSKLIEHLKTTQHNILESLKQLKQEVTPVINVMKNLLEDEEEETNE